jgi:DNA-binding winged helix-turn-helix (wHTH) protein/TolB-like protein/Tfp pilus assembly protein PilF
MDGPEAIVGGGSATGSANAPASEASANLRVGDWLVETRAHRISNGGREIKLEPKAMALLVYLARHVGSTLSREQLFEAIWPGVIVSDDTLTQAVTKLRKAFGDNARKPCYIETVPKIGYRLCAPVSFETDRASPSQTGRKSSSRNFFIGALVLVVSLGAIFFLADRPNLVLPGTGAPAPVVSDELPTLAVEPFRLLGQEDGAQTYLAQGLSYDLITDLSKLSGLLIIGSRSIMGQKTDLPPLYPVRYRVQGEVQRIDDELRVHVHLFDARSGRQLWSERFLQPIDNLFKIQEAVSRQIVSTLAIKVDEAELARLAHRYTDNVHAYEFFLQAQSLLLVRLGPENKEAQRLFRLAIELDPSFARAYGGLALAYAAEFRNQWSSDGAAALQRAQSMARTALEIDPEIPEVYWVLAYISAQRREHAQAISLLRKAVSLDQSFADAYALMGGVETYMGRPAETLPLMRMAIRLNPDAGYLYFLLLGRAYFYLGDWEQSLINISEALERNPTNLEARIYLAAVREASGDHEEAAWQRDEILALQQDFSTAAWLQTYPMTDRQQHAQLLSTLQKLGL